VLVCRTLLPITTRRCGAAIERASNGTGLPIVVATLVLTAVGHPPIAFRLAVHSSKIGRAAILLNDCNRHRHCGSTAPFRRQAQWCVAAASKSALASERVRRRSGPDPVGIIQATCFGIETTLLYVLCLEQASLRYVCRCVPRAQPRFSSTAACPGVHVQFNASVQNGLGT
jgi:hypothetical protein